MTSNSREITFSPDELIISKTDLRGNITYANRCFMRVSNYPESDLVGNPHNMIRHPDMPRGVYYAMWKTLKSKKEFFGFVKNLTSDGNFYWVFANVTPDLVQGKIQGFFSVRRSPPKHAIHAVESVYREMRAIEMQASTADAPKKSWEWLEAFLSNEHGVSYEEFALKLYQEKK